MVATYVAMLLPLLLAVQGLGLQDRPMYCKLQPESGLCLAYFPMYFYNVTSLQCEIFIYGGCQGNQNRFATKERCEEVCHAEIRSQDGSPAHCNLMPEVGMCLARIPRYYFNSETNRCEIFYYGGCGGNANNFGTLKDCESYCLSKFS